MTEREAWHKLADYIEGQLFHRDGLCDLTYYMRFHWHEIDSDVFTELRLKISAVPERGTSAFKWPLTAEGHRQRAAWCREQAAKCEGMVSSGRG